MEFRISFRKDDQMRIGSLSGLTTIGFGIFSGFLSFSTWNQKAENHRLNLVNSILTVERNILKDEISQLEHKPTYEEGFKDAIIRMGGPQTPGSYLDGWDAAIKVIGDSGYADGYHAAIQQFGYQKLNETKRWMVPEPKTLANPDQEKK